MTTKSGLLASLLLAGLTLAGAASAGTLDHIRQDGAIRIAYREDAPPFSLKGPDGAPAGYSVELCRAVANDISVMKKMESDLEQAVQAREDVLAVVKKVLGEA